MPHYMLFWNGNYCRTPGDFKIDPHGMVFLKGRACEGDLFDLYVIDDGRFVELREMRCTKNTPPGNPLQAEILGTKPLG